MMYGFFRVAAASPQVKVAHVSFHAQRIISCVKAASGAGVGLLVFPELSLTAYTCGDLFFQSSLLAEAQQQLQIVLEQTASIPMLLAIGMPVVVDDALYNCAILALGGKILGAVPKTHLPNYGEFYEKRWFSSGANCPVDTITLAGQQVPFGTDLLFCDDKNPLLRIGIELCEDLWAPVPPSSLLALDGALLIANLSASNELATKPDYRRSLVCSQSASCVAAYVYASAAYGESTQDTVFSGHCMIAENGSLLGESPRFSADDVLLIRDVDLQALHHDRLRNPGFTDGLPPLPSVRKISFHLTPAAPVGLRRTVSPAPFVPKDDDTLASRCEDIFSIQVAGLAKRVSHTHADTMVLGISGGLDSTLALLVCAKACDFLDISRSHILGVTMPGFGTTGRTYQNALSLMKTLGVTMREIPIRDAALQHFKDIGHDPACHDVTYENTQARERTQILMDLANQENGLVVGTGDLSELALGWATYNGDHMSMYGVNAGVPKTLVRVLVDYVAKSGSVSQEAAQVLKDVLLTPVSPELLPPDDQGNINQKTEDIVGPYELHDFFLYYAVRFGFRPEKILYLAEQAFSDAYSRTVLLHWLRNFYRRFFQQQFKRSCLPDGPKVGTISLSPRGDWRMPSDAECSLWLEEVDALK